jgi:hypothetical protein
MEILREKCEAVDLATLSSPYLPKTFTKWRREAYQGPSLAFAREVDEELLPRFLEQVQARYFDTIVSSPTYSQSLGLSHQDLLASAEFNRLASILSHWSAELELTTDLLDRSQLYGLYQMSPALSVSFTSLQREWGSGTEPNLKRMYRFLLQSVGYVADRAASVIRTHVVGVVAGNMDRSRNALIAGTVYAYLCGSVPWLVLTILGTQVAWVASGWLLMKAGKGIGAGLDRKQLEVHLRELSSQFAVLTGQLNDLNERAKAGIRTCLAAPTPQERVAPVQDLARTLESFVQKRVEGEREQSSFNQDETALDYMQIKEEEDWLVIEAEEPAVVQLTKSLFTIDTPDRH